MRKWTIHCKGLWLHIGNGSPAFLRILLRITSTHFTININGLFGLFVPLLWSSILQNSYGCRGGA